MTSTAPTPAGPISADERLYEPVPLSTLCRGCRGRVHCRVAGPEGDVLAAMGLTDRSAVRVCRGGEPCIIEVASARLALSAALARQILIRPFAGPPPTAV